MAAKGIEHLKEHFLSCDICVEIYEDPITLACGHTFCRKCYIRYCQENREATRRRNLQCPTCKQCSNVKNPGQKVDGSWNVEDWVKPLKPSFVIRKLLDDFVTKESGDGLRSGRKKTKVVCPIHKSDIAYFCKKCKIPVCSDCGLQNHMKCSDIVKIESMGSEIKSNLETTLETITLTTQQIEQLVKEVKDQIGNFKIMELNVRENINMSRENTIKMIEEWERKTLEELNSVAENHNSQMTAPLKTWETDLQMFRQHSEFIRRTLEEDEEMDMIDTYTMCHFEDILTKADRSTQLDLPQGVAGMQLDMCFDQTDTKKNCHLGNLRIKKKPSLNELRRRKYKPLTASPLDKIDMSILGSGQPDILVMEVDGADIVIVTDFHNSCLNSFYLSDYSIGLETSMPYVSWCSSLHFQHEPWSVIRLSSNQVAVSFADTLLGQIVLVKVTPDLTLQTTITTQRPYKCLTSLDENTLVAGCQYPPYVDILDLSGQVKRTISPDGSLIQNPRYLSTTQEGNILVSDCGSKNVVCLTPGGDVVFTHSPTGDRALRTPSGIATTTTGDILVADYSNNKVIQLTGEGEYVRDLITSQDGITCIFGISVFQDMLFITQGGTGKCKVVKLSERKLMNVIFKLVIRFSKLVMNFIKRLVEFTAVTCLMFVCLGLVITLISYIFPIR